MATLETPLESNDPAQFGTRNSGHAIARFLWPLLIVGVSLVSFWPGFQNTFVNWDDEKIIVKNSNYRGLSGTELKWMFTTVYMCHYQPLGWLSYAVDYSIWGLSPRGFFLTNLLIHSATALCFYFLSRRLLRMVLTWPPNDTQHGAAIAAMLFAVHPLRVESVVWLSERRDVLSGFFFVLSLICYARFSERAARIQIGFWWYGAALLSYVASLLTKSTAVGMPLVLLLLDLYPLRRWRAEPGQSRHRVALRLLFEKAPFAFMAAVAALVAIYAQRQAETMAPITSHGIGARLLVAAYALVFYLIKSLIPWGLSPFVPMSAQVDFFTFRFGGSAILVVLMGAILFAMRRRWPLGIVLSGVYVVLLLPVLGLVQIGPQLVADRYSYLSCLGFAVVLGAGTIAAQRELTRVGQLAVVFLRVAVFVVIGVLCLLTRSQIDVWRNSASLWTWVLQRYPDSDIAHVGMALAYGEKGRIPETIRHLKRATELSPSWPQPHSDLGVALLLQGDYAEASRSLERAVELLPLRAESWNDLGATYLQLGRLEQAQEAFERAVTLEPTYAMAHYNLAQLLARFDKNREAIEHLRLAVRAEPDSATFLENLAWFLATCPEDSLRGGPEAVRLAEQVCRQTAYQQPSCLDALAAAYAEVGRFEEAVQTCDLARRLASKTGDTDLARQIDERLDLYRSRHAYRSPLP